MKEQNQLPAGSMIAGLTPQQMQHLQAQAAQTQFPNQMIATGGNPHQIVAPGGNMMSQFPPQYQQQIQLQRQYHAQAQAQTRAQLQQQQMQQLQRQQQFVFQQQQQQQQQLRQAAQLQQSRRNSQISPHPTAQQIHQQAQQQHQLQQPQMISHSKEVGPPGQAKSQPGKPHPNASHQSSPQNLPANTPQFSPHSIPHSVFRNQKESVPTQPSPNPQQRYQKLQQQKQPQEQQPQKQQQEHQHQANISSQIPQPAINVKSSPSQNKQNQPARQPQLSSQQFQQQQQQKHVKGSAHQMAHNQQNFQSVNTMNPKASQAFQQVVPPNGVLPTQGATNLNNSHSQQHTVPRNQMVPTNSFNSIPAIIKQTMAITRLNQFSEALSKATDKKNTIEYWRDVLNEFFAENAVLKYVIETEAEEKSYNLPFAIIPRLYHTLTTSGVEKIQLNFECARPSSMPNGLYIECPRISISYWFGNDTIVTTKGHLRVVMNPKLKFEFMEQTSRDFNEFIARTTCISSISTKTGVPKSKVGMFGFTEEVIRFLQLSETAVQMRELFFQASLSNAESPLSLFEKLASQSLPQNQDFQLNQQSQYLQSDNSVKQQQQQQQKYQQEQRQQPQQHDINRPSSVKSEDSSKPINIKNENTHYAQQQMANEQVFNSVNVGHKSPNLAFSNSKLSESPNNLNMMKNPSLARPSAYQKSPKSGNMASPKLGHKRKRQNLREDTSSSKVKSSPKISKK